MISQSAILSELAPSPMTDKIYSDDILIGHMVAFEEAYLDAQGRLQILDNVDAQFVLAALDGFVFDSKKLRQAAKRDGVVVAELVREMREFAMVKTNYADWIHKGLTSQDVIDTALAMSYQQLNQDFASKLENALTALDALDNSFGGNPMMGRTRMQAALEIKVSDRLRAWREPLKDLQKQLPDIRASLEVVTLGGAVG